MRVRLAHFGLLAVLLTGLQPTYAQNPDYDSRFATPCTTASHPDEPSAPAVSISEITFSGFIQMPVSYQDAIIATVKREEHGSFVDGVVEEALERVRAGWQNHGYFQVEVSGEDKVLAKTETEVRIALFVHVDEGAKYRLGGIKFKNNKLLSDSAKLRDLFPIKDGDIFGREKIAEGLENLRKESGDQGYINFTGVPSTTFDEEKKLAHLEIDVDEGKRFTVGSVKVIGLDEAAREKVLKEYPIKPGQVYNSKLRQLSLKTIPPLSPGCGCSDPTALHLDERPGRVDLLLDFRPCPGN